MMEDQIAFVQTQLWIVMGMFGLLVGMNLICAYARRLESKKTPPFGTMWEKDELDQLIEKARSHLLDYPNNVDALYFAAKAYLAREQYEKARPLVERFKATHPTEKDSWQPMLDLIESRERS